MRSRVEVGLLRAYEAYIRARSSAPEPLFAEGLPVPPAKLRVLVCGSADPNYFLDAGRGQAELFARMLARNGVAREDFGAVLDFGCGCGRIARWWADVPGPAMYGCDPNRELVGWTRENLPFVNASVSWHDPPLPYPDATFDFVYALSIFTHLAERHALSWMDELRRVLKPGGLLLFTVAGEAYRERLTPEEAARYARGEEVVQFGSARGTNLCIAYHSPAFVRERLLRDRYEVADVMLTPEHPDEVQQAQMPQDCYLARAL